MITLEENITVDLEFITKVKYTCIHCGKKIISDKLPQSISIHKSVCDKCLELKYFTCECCGDIVNNVHQHLDSSICNDCYDRNYFECECCGDLTHNDIGTGRICNYCVEENYRSCGGCGDLIHLDDIRYLEERDCYYCVECYRERTSFKDYAEKLLMCSDFTPTNNLKCFGIEIEAITHDSIDLHGKHLKHFNVVSDASLNEGGKEFVTVPLKDNKEHWDIVKAFCNDFAKNNLDIDSSCGLHIHLYLDDKFITIENLHKIVLIYQKLESLFFSIVPKSRLNNDFCKSLFVNSLHERLLETETLPGFLTEFYGFPVDSLRNSPADKYHRNRYYWVNLNSVFYRNTIEIRLHSGTTNFNKIYLWFKLNQYVLNYALAHSYNEIKLIDLMEFMYALPTELKEYVNARREQFNLLGKNNNEIEEEHIGA